MAFRTLYPQEYLRKFVTQGVRPDGRRLDKYRKLGLSCGTITTAAGSSFVRLGNTSAVAGVRAEVGPAYVPAAVSGKSLLPLRHRQPLEQQVVVNVDLPALCASKFRGRHSHDEATVHASRLNSLLSAAVSVKSLAFDPDSRFVWYLAVDVVCLNYDGALFDALLLAAVSALSSTTLRRGTVSEEGAPVPSSEHVGLELTSVPLAATFALFEQSLLTDPSNEEEGLAGTTVTVVVDGKDGTLRDVVKSGGAPVADEVLSQCLKAAGGRVTQLLGAVDKARQQQQQKSAI